MSAGRFVVSDDGLTVTDTASGLAWTREDASTEDVDHSEAQAAVEALNAAAFAGHTDWRLPTVDELFPLADRTRTDPAIDTDAFPNCASDWYRTSTPYAASPSAFAWIVSFDFGNANGVLRGYGFRVRAVRGPVVSPRQ